VQLYAATLLKAESIEPPANATNYDPLQNHTLGRFLDRFVYKNPKNTQSKGSSLMQPQGLKSDDMIVVGGAKKRTGLMDGKALDDAPVNSNMSWKDENHVPTDEMFFYKFFEATGTKETSDDMKAAAAARSDEIEEEVEEDMDEDEVWKAMQKSSGFAATGLNKEDEDELSDEDQVWPDEEEEESEQEDGSEQDVGSDDGGLEVDGSDDDGEMEAWMEKEEEEDENAPKKPVRGKRSILKMSEKAKELGFTGDYFDKLLISKEQDDSGEFNDNVFAQADDFESLVDLEQNEEDREEKGEKRKGGFASRRKQTKKIRRS
jgi:ribosome biogenesis protein MAK21